MTYAIDRASDRRRQFAISEDGTVTIQRALDRETVPTHQVKILAIGEVVCSFRKLYFFIIISRENLSYGNPTQTKKLIYITVPGTGTCKNIKKLF